MRTNIDIDDALMSRALQAGPYKTKKEAVEAGLELLARRAAYREVLKWRGKLKWEGDDSVNWPAATRAEAMEVQEGQAAYVVKKKAKQAATSAATKASRARR